MERSEVILKLINNGWELFTENEWQEIYIYPKDKDMLPVPKREKIEGHPLHYILSVILSKK